MAFRVRHLILILCVMSSAVVYITRININIAIVAMVEPISQSINSNKTTLPSDGPAPSTNRLQTCPLANKTSASASPSQGDVHHLHASPDKTSDNSSSPPPEMYKWDQGMQGLVLGSFYYTYILFQIPSGLLAERFGGRTLISFALIGSCVINAVTPFIASYATVMIVSRLLLGAFQAGMYPGAFAMCNTWLKLKERAFAFALTESGACVGTIFTYFSSGFISESLGWPWVFYVSGLIALFSLVIFFLLASDDPKRHPCIGRNELIERSDEPVIGTKSTSQLSTPWVGILTCPAVLAAALFKFSIGWTYTTLGSKLPAYLNDIMHEDISSNGVINGIMNLIFTLSMGIGGLASERIIQRKLASRTATRKLYSIVSGFGSAFCILLIPLAGCDRMALLTILYVGSFCLGSASGSDVPLASEMSNNFPATLYSLLNMIQMSPGFITPSFVGFLLDGSSDLRSSWARVFYFSSFLTAVSTVIFILFASAERQKFDMQSDTTQNDQGQVDQQQQRIATE